KKEFELIGRYLEGEEGLAAEPCLEKHLHWMERIKPMYKQGMDANLFISEEAGKVFSEVLKAAGVFKMDAAGEAAFEEFASDLLR
ncbi:MAG: galactose-1-phosphate uridylyltransferase, partial [Bacilli bacterium]